MSNKQRFCSTCHLPVHGGRCFSVDNRTSDYVCVECGVNYLSDEQKNQSRISTFSDSVCGLCGEYKPTTSIRHYNYLVHPDYWKSRQEMKLRRKLYREEKKKIPY